MSAGTLISISRQGLELGKLPVGEANELLGAGFLLPTDEFWTDENAERRALCELGAISSSVRPGWLKRARTSVVTTTSVVMERAGHITHKVSEAIRGSRSMIGTVTTKVLEDYAPRLRELAATQLKATAQSTKAALKDETFLRKLFGAVYDCLPKPVYRFVSEQAFVEYCLKHRRKLLDGSDSKD